MATPKYLAHLRYLAKLGAFADDHPRATVILKNDPFFNTLEKIITNPDHPNFIPHLKSEDFQEKVQVLKEAGLIGPSQLVFERRYDFNDDNPEQFEKMLNRFIHLTEPQKVAYLKENPAFAQTWRKVYY